MPMTPTWLSQRAIPTLCRSNWMAFHDGHLIIIWLSMCQSHMKWLSEAHAPRQTCHSFPSSSWSGMWECFGGSSRLYFGSPGFFWALPCCVCAGFQVHLCPQGAERGTISGRFVGPPPSATSLRSTCLVGLHRCLLETAFAGCDRGCVCRLWSIGWGDLVSYPLNSLHMRNSVNTCVELFRQVLHNKFHVLYQLLPPEKLHHMRYAQVPVNESSLGQTKNFASILLFACFTNLNFFPCFRYHH